MTLITKPKSRFISQIKDIIYQRQYEALKQVNGELIQLYWDIGREIVSQQNDKGWGRSIVEELSKELSLEFPGIQGFSPQNLWRMRNFYITFSSSEKLALMVREISWTKNVAIMEKCKDEYEREFYMKMTKKYGWTKDVLINHIDNKSYEKYLINQTNFDKTLEENHSMFAKLAVKDDYTFDFVELGSEHREAKLENLLIKNIRSFLTEMGGDFTFIDSQYHIEVDGEDFYIDLLLFHRQLRSLVAIELKIGDFKPEFAGKMQFYLTALDKQVKYEAENPSIGIIICKNKSRTIVEYTLNTTDKPIGVTTYNNYTKLPDDLKSLLPSPEEIEKRLTIID